MNLASHARNVHSQFGEDGMIDEMLNRIGDEHLTKWCVEFGAWDGVHLSNTCNLIRSRGYSAVLIEGDPAKAAAIAQNHPTPSVLTRIAMVQCEGPDTLDNILAGTPIPERFDLLSIDIDGADYWILESLRRYRPLIIVIEYNPSIPNAVHFVQERSTAVQRGSSARAILELAMERGYRLAATTTANLLLVHEEHAESVLDAETVAASAGSDAVALLDSLRAHDPVYAFALFDGTVCTSRRVTLNWHGTTLPSTELYRVPRPFRSPMDWGKRRRFAWRIYRRLRLR
ncbi:MAG: hypothetical protein F2873_05590 [Actinobacteria bacterium]|uniref:Unannotated protein n=1 Tax=freshwater metagenome TaxID=449393 RepID=A0A6J7NJ18_9ZZZZ|nr:hypothetical protein [Actinomycetota bacterium]